MEREIAPRVARAASTGILLAAFACGAEDPVPRQLKARLEAALDVHRAEQPSPDELRAALSRQLRSQPAQPIPGSQAPFPSRETIAGYYASNGHRLIWSDAGGTIVPAAGVLLEVVRDAGVEGLSPDDYAIDRLTTLEKEIREQAPGDRAARIADFDLLATAVFLRYGADLSTGRVHPGEVHSDWHTNPPEVDLVKALGEVASGADVRQVLSGLPPPHPGYARLRDALARLREVEAAGGWPTIPDGPKIGRRAAGQRVALLRQRLGLPAGDRYDEELGRAVQRFQALHGLEPDGVVGEPTLSALNVPVADRIRQVELNLERWRWIPRELGDPHVLVNIPAFELELARRGAAPWRTRVVTGKAYTPTPVFSDRIVALVVHPAWNVPESIAVNELLPELRKNPAGLARQGMRILDGAGENAREIDPASIDWRRLDPERFPYRLVQAPGDKNPLGNVKFVLTNKLSIYLHDTPADAVFARSDRGVSHGCVRVERAPELAFEIASEPVREKLEEAFDRPEERSIDLDGDVPVHLFYWTAWADEAGELHFGPDVYGFDAPQREAIERTAGRAG